MRRTSVCSAALLLAALVTPARVVSQQPDSAEQARVREAMMAAMQPGPEHERLAELAGEWSMDIRMWPAPGAEPMQSSGTAENRMILGNRFLESRSAGGQEPMRIESLILLGFDRRVGRYTSIGLDTWGTYYVTADGVAEPDGTIVLDGVNEDPVSKARETYRMVIRRPDADTYVQELIFTDPVHTRNGEPFKMIEITYRRR